MAAQDTQQIDGAGGRLLRQGWIYLVANAMKLGAVALAIPIATRLLTPVDYGIVTLATTLQLLLGTVAALGLPDALLRFFYDGKHGEATARALIGSSVVVALLVTLAIAGLVLLAGALGSGYVVPLLFGAALGLPTAVVGACRSLLRAQNRRTAFVVVSLISTVGAQALAVVGVAINPEPVTYLAGVMVAMAGSMVAGLALTRSLTARPASRPTLRAALAYGLPMVPYSVSVFGLAFADRFVIAAIDGSSAVGKYQIAFAFGFLGVVLVQSLQLAWVPMTFAAHASERWRMLADVSGTVARMAALCSGFLALIAAPALAVLVPGAYDTPLLADVAVVAALGTAAWAVSLARTQVLLWTKRTGPLFWILPVALVINLALVGALLPPFGLVGAAAASVVAIVVQTVLTDRAARKAAAVSWPIGTEFAAYGVAAACCGLALALPDSGWGLGARLALGALVGLRFLQLVASEFRLTRRVAAEPVQPGLAAGGLPDVSSPEPG